MITFKNSMDADSVEEVFNQINSRYIAAVMMHGQFADYFDFLGLKGYQKMHEYQHFTEAKERRNLCRYYIRHHGKLPTDEFSGEVSIIPESWKSASRIGIGKSTKQKAVEDGFAEWHAWESETKTVYEKYAERLRSLGEITDCVFVTFLAKGVADELERIEGCIVNLISTGYDMVYITEMQAGIEMEYVDKMRGMGAM